MYYVFHAEAFPIFVLVILTEDPSFFSILWKIIENINLANITGFSVISVFFYLVFFSLILKFYRGGAVR